MNKVSQYIKYILPAMIGFFMLAGCVDEYNTELPDSDTHLLVVNGTIKSNTINRFSLSWSSSINSNTTISNRKEDVVSGASIKIHNTDGLEYECAENATSPGTYECVLPELNKDASYYITIKTGHDVYESTPEKPIRTQGIESVEYLQADSMSDIDILITTAEPANPNETNYITWDYCETWELRPLLRTFVYFNLQDTCIEYGNPFPDKGWKDGRNTTMLTESTLHYKNGKFTKYRLYTIPRTNERVYWYYSSLITQRALSKAEYEYQTAARQSGWEMGGLFTPQPSVLPGNIHCTTSDKRAIGYIGCSLNMIEKRLYIDGTTLSREIPQPSKITYLPDCDEATCAIIASQKTLYEWYDQRPQGKLETKWGNNADFDVRLHGAYTTKPDYMPPFE